MQQDQETYMLVLFFFLAMLEFYKMRLSEEEITCHLDLQFGLRNGMQDMLYFFNYKFAIVMEIFHQNQAIKKKIDECGLKGLYVFTNKNDECYFNGYRHLQELVYCLKLIHYVGETLMTPILEQLMFNTLDELPTDYAVEKYDHYKSGIQRFWQWYYPNLGGGTNSRYTGAELSGYMLSMRSSNPIEVKHSVLGRDLGKHENFIDFHDGMKQVEFDEVHNFIQHKEQGVVKKQTKEIIEREKATWRVWQKIENEKSKYKNEYHGINVMFWMDCLIELRDIHYGIRDNKKRRKATRKNTR